MAVVVPDISDISDIAPTRLSKSVVPFNHPFISRKNIWMLLVNASVKHCNLDTI